MKKLVENLLSWCKKSMKMRRCVGKSTAPVTGQSVGQTGNAEGVLPSTATETVDEIVLPAAVETAGMVETIDEKAAFGKSGRKKPENMLDALQRFLTIRYDFRYNLLTEQTEYRGKEMPDEEYAMVAQRDLNTFCLEARTGGINCRNKAVDPAVVVLDECGHFAVPILSGHLGGANDLARALAAVCGAVPVITTATDANGVFAVDAWARHQNCAVLEPGRIKRVSSRLLAGGPVRYRSEFPIAGQAPAGVVPAGEAERADFALTLFPAGDALHLIPKIGVLGIGCRRGTSAAQLEAAFAQFCAAHGLAAACITAAASIDLKAHEPGLLEFCRIHGWPVQFYSAAQLQNAPGQFTPSAFVRNVTGVDNVCERAAVLAAGGTIILPKQAGNGVTFALALRPFAPDWRWQDA